MMIRWLSGLMIRFWCRLIIYRILMIRVLFIWRRGRMMIGWSFFVKWRISWIIHRSGIVMAMIGWRSGVLLIRRLGWILLITWLNGFMIR